MVEQSEREIRERESLKREMREREGKSLTGLTSSSYKRSLCAREDDLTGLGDGSTLITPFPPQSVVFFTQREGQLSDWMGNGRSLTSFSSCRSLTSVRIALERTVTLFHQKKNTFFFNVTETPHHNSSTLTLYGKNNQY